MDICTEHDTDICTEHSEVYTEHSEVYEPPMLDEIGGFTALTRLNNRGRYADANGYYNG